MHVDAWRGAYRGLLPDALLAALSVEQRERSWAELLAAGRGVVLVAEPLQVRLRRPAGG